MISYIDNIGYSNRRARVDITSEALPSFSQLLMDAGFRIIGSVQSPGDECKVRLRIEGSSLPDVCEGFEPLVTIMVQQESYGSQRINRISGIELLNAPQGFGQTQEVA